MFNKLEEILKEIEGNVLTVCLDEKLMKFAYNNDKINLYSIESNINSGLFRRKRNKRKTNKGKTINIKKLRKYINKKSVKYMFCNMNEMFNYYKYFIKDSIYLNNNKLYLYFDKNIDKELIIKNYKRYNIKIEEIEYKNSYLLIIDNTNSKSNLLKDIIYFIKDTLYNIAEAIGNLLIS